MIRFQGRNGERGAVIVALLLLLTLVGALALVPPPRPAGDADIATRAALSEARQALLGYAAAYPDRVNQQFGPGYLPCPARDERGIAGPACGVGSATTRGRFPWHTLRTNDLRDGAGEVLWYALSERHRYNPKYEPMNSSTAPSLDLDGDAVVAVVIAPGAALVGQRARRQHRHATHEFLDGLNGDADVTRYSRAGDAATMNDQVLALSGRQFMQAIEARVLGELAQRLRRYAAAHGGHYPWLSNAGSGHAAGLANSARTSVGWLPFHYVAPTWTAPHGQTFSTEVTLSWAFSAAVPTLDEADDELDLRCLLNSTCAHDDTSFGTRGLRARALCRWWTPAAELAPREFAHCALVQRVTRGLDTFEYDISFAIRDADGDIEISGPHGQAPRTRRIATHLPLANSAQPELFIRISLRAIGPDGSQGGAVVKVSAATRGHFAVAGIRYAADVNDGELPAWLIRNHWLDEVRLAWAASDCVLNASCLTLRTRTAAGAEASREVRALAVAAGTPLDGAPKRAASAPLAAWFEDGNRLARTDRPIFDALPYGPRFNDTIRVIEPGP